VSVPEMKAFLGLIINMGLMPLPDIKDNWSSEWITHKIFCDVMSFCRYFGLHMWEMISLKKAVGVIRRTKKVHGVIEYIVKQFQNYFSFCALVAPTSRAKQLA
jgi:hypothetical protein